MNIIQRIIPRGQTKQRPGYAMTPKYITVHNTANASKGANAEMHARYLLNGGGGRTVGWHYTVDDKSIYQHLPVNESGFHAGDGNGPGNRQSIGIEICENVDGDFDKAVKNAQWLIAKLMKEHNIPLSNVVPHKHWTGKNCPRKLLSTWNSFKLGIAGTSVKQPSETIETKVQGVSSKPKPQNKPSKAPKKTGITVDGKWGPSTTRALQQALGTPVDGIISSQPKNSVTNALYGGVTWGSKGSPMVRALQRKVGAKADGKLGPETIRKLQKYLGTPVDGVISRPSSMVVKELQHRLNKGNL